jgi:hypothetical protein
MDETLTSEVVFVARAVRDDVEDVANYLDNEHQVLHENIDAMRVSPEDLDAFLELVYAADAEYMDVQEYLPEPQNTVDWDDVSRALQESQKIMMKTQELLSETLAEMGIQDHSAIRVYSDVDGALRLVVDHPRQAEIEAELNSPRQRPLRDMYASATAGMSVAGSLVGSVSVPDEVLERMRESRCEAAAS